MCEVGVFLPNRDLISESEHTMCKDATRHCVAPILPVGRLALKACGEGGAVHQSPAHNRHESQHAKAKKKKRHGKINHRN